MYVSTWRQHLHYLSLACSIVRGDGPSQVTTCELLFRGHYKTLRASVCPPFLQETLSSYATGFRELLCWGFLQKLLEQIYVWCRSSNNSICLCEDLRTIMLIFCHLQDKCKTCGTAREAKEIAKGMYRILRSRRCDLHANNVEKSPNASLICCVFIF